jgi:hypothetical protein
MKKIIKKLNMRNANLMCEQHYLNSFKKISETVDVYGTNEIKYMVDTDNDEILLNNRAKNILLKSNLGLSELNFGHPEPYVDFLQYNWSLPIGLVNTDTIVEILNQN